MPAARARGVGDAPNDPSPDLGQIADGIGALSAYVNPYCPFAGLDALAACQSRDRPSDKTWSIC